LWPFKSRIPVVKDIIFENEGQTMTIIHDKGAYKFNKEDILVSHFSIDLYSPPKVNLLLSDVKSIMIWLLFLGGFMNVLTSPDLNYIIELLVFAGILAYLTVVIYKFIMKYVLIKYDFNFPNIKSFTWIFNLDFQNDLKKDILNISSYNVNFKMRSNQWGIKRDKEGITDSESWYDSIIKLGYIKEISSSRKYSSINHLFANPNDLHFITKLSIYIILILIILTKWDMPFMLREYIDNRIRFIFPENYIYGNLTNFKEYYSENHNIVVLFFDGIVGAFFNLITIVIGIFSFIWPLVLYFLFSDWFFVKQKKWNWFFKLPFILIGIISFLYFFTTTNPLSSFYGNVYLEIGFFVTIFSYIHNGIKDLSTLIYHRK